MLAGLPEATPDSVRQMPWWMAAMGLVLGMFQAMPFSEPTSWWVWAGCIVGGAAWGTYVRYRARYAIDQGMCTCLLLMWWMMLMCAGPAALAARMADLPSLVMPAFLLVLAYFVCLAVWGWWRGERRWRVAAQAGNWDAWVADHVNLQTWQLKQGHVAAPALPRSLAIWPAVGVNLPLFVAAVWSDRGELWLVMGVLLVFLSLFGWLVLRLMPDFATYLHLRRYERAHGRRFASAYRDALAQARSQFWLRHWLCRPEDRVAPVAAPTKRRARGRR